MKLNKITDPHKATIKRHLEESLTVKVPLDQIHEDLREIFECKGRYSLPQITAYTSWLRSTALSSKRTEPIPTNELEDGEKTSEDADFDNPVKNRSRDWFMGHFEASITEELRESARFLLLPGQYCHDLEAVTQRLRIPGRNLVTYIRGDVPRANAQYVRNIRRYGVVDRRIGDMTELLPAEAIQVDAAYLDLFGQYCPSFDQILKTLPVPPNKKVIPIGVNLREGREHGETVGDLQAVANVMKGQVGMLLNANTDRERTLQTLSLVKEGREDRPEVLRDARDRAMAAMLFSGVGIACPKQWVLYESIAKFVKCTGKNEDFEHLEPQEKFRIYREMIHISTAIFCESAAQARRTIGIDIDLNELGFAVAMATVNSPLIRKCEKPERYISPNGHTPFISFFAVLETIRDQYLKHSEAFKFYLDVVTEELPIALEHAKHGYKPDQHGKLMPDGARANRRIIYRGISGSVHGIEVQKLQDACVEIGNYFAVTNSDPIATGMTPNELAAFNGIATAKAAQRMIDSGERVLKSIEFDGTQIIIRLAKPQTASSSRIGHPPMPPLLGSNMHIGRNDPCPCGSGCKFKKCCMRRI